MAIKMIDRIPGHTPVLTAHDGLVSDILKIVDEPVNHQELLGKVTDSSNRAGCYILRMN